MTPAPEFLEWFEHWRAKGFVEVWAPVGSRFTCNPPPTDTDEDYIVLSASPEKMDQLAYLLVTEEAFEHTEGYDPDTWDSLRNGNINYILMSDPLEYAKFILARDVCKKLNVMDKDDRKLVHNAIMYGHKGETE